MTGKSTKTIINIFLSLVFLSGCTAGIQPLTPTETTAPTITETIAPTVTNTRQPTHTPTQSPTATPTATVEPADGTPEKYLQILNGIYEKYEPSAATNPFWANHYLSPDGRYLALQSIIRDEPLTNYLFYDITENQQIDIPLDLKEHSEINVVDMDSWSWDGSSLLLRLAPQIGLYGDTDLFVIQSIDERNFTEYVFPYPEDMYSAFTLNQDGSEIIFYGGFSDHNKFFVLEILSNFFKKYTLPDGVYPKDILYYEESDFLILNRLDREGHKKITQLRIVHGATGESEVVYCSKGFVFIVDYDPDRKMVLIKNAHEKYIFLDTETWVETTFLEEDALFGQETKLIGNCIPSNFESEDGGLRAGLYNLITGEIEILGDISYIGWYPLFENHLVVVNNGEGDYWIEFLDVVCE